MCGEARQRFLRQARVAWLMLVVLCSSACTTYGVVDHKPLSPSAAGGAYSLSGFTKNLTRHSGELALIVAFSGGGTRPQRWSVRRAAGTARHAGGIEWQERNMLDAIAAISSVSGGSFTSAYYGLYGERIFIDFEERFLP